ncbi:hypothetical protein CDD80_6130 [Ophiocordyceps camponoti-rufipedis]|uniref:Uncharacterized protein n=1 Tax=Ophiocordyceps camponoti-rufipedis TaxID=2004952 RepID=A0A2C5YNA3_9HYPO|nr:hypothetical protein CDD80_6130 [Ophiocordyceps camponoti-rufipedis]
MENTPEAGVAHPSPVAAAFQPVAASGAGLRSRNRERLAFLRLVTVMRAQIITTVTFSSALANAGEGMRFSLLALAAMAVGLRAAPASHHHHHARFHAAHRASTHTHAIPASS